LSYNLKLTGKGNSILKKTASGLNPKDVSLALKQLGECGAGADLDFGFIILPDFNSSSGDIDRFVGLYVVDGELVIDSVENVKAAICAFKSNDYVSATSVTITGCPTSGTFAEGDTVPLTATVNPTGALQNGTWTSSNTGRATVNSSGLVTAGPNDGVVVITFTSADGGFTGTCSITIAN